MYRYGVRAPSNVKEGIRGIGEERPAIEPSVSWTVRWEATLLRAASNSRNEEPGDIERLIDDDAIGICKGYRSIDEPEVSFWKVSGLQPGLFIQYSPVNTSNRWDLRGETSHVSCRCFPLLLKLRQFPQSIVACPSTVICIQCMGLAFVVSRTIIAHRGHLAS